MQRRPAFLVFGVGVGASEQGIQKNRGIANSRGVVQDLAFGNRIRSPKNRNHLAVA